MKGSFSLPPGALHNTLLATVVTPLKVELQGAGGDRAGGGGQCPAGCRHHCNVVVASAPAGGTALPPPYHPSFDDRSKEVDRWDLGGGDCWLTDSFGLKVLFSTRLHVHQRMNTNGNWHQMIYFPETRIQVFLMGYIMYIMLLLCTVYATLTLCITISGSHDGAVFCVLGHLAMPSLLHCPESTDAH
jgi:hypothetical protein